MTEIHDWVLTGHPQFIILYRQEVNIDFLCSFFTFRFFYCFFKSCKYSTMECTRVEGLSVPEVWWNCSTRQEFVMALSSLSCILLKISWSPFWYAGRWFFNSSITLEQMESPKGASNGLVVYVKCSNSQNSKQGTEGMAKILLPLPSLVRHTLSRAALYVMCLSRSKTQ